MYYYYDLYITEYFDVSVNDLYFLKIYLDGPYGEGHQDWNTYDVAILIGGGIGVTPFASILKDVSYNANRQRTHCKKVSTHTWKQFYIQIKTSYRFTSFGCLELKNNSNGWLT